MEVDQGEKVEVRVAGRWACDHFIDYFHPNDDDDQGRGVVFHNGEKRQQVRTMFGSGLAARAQREHGDDLLPFHRRDLYLGAASQPSRARQEERTAWYNKRLMREGIRT